MIKKLKHLWKFLLHTPFLTLGFLAIIAAAIPLTINLGTHTTNYQQHASTTPNNWCNSQNPSNALGVCGTHGWGICTSQGSCDTGKNTFDPQSNDGECRGFDDNSGCCYPKTVPKDYGGQAGSYSNKAGLCGNGGYGMCMFAGSDGCLDVTNHSFTSIIADVNSACKGYPVANPTNYSVFGCCYPNSLTTSDRKSQVSCNTGGPPPNQLADTIYDHLDGANCSTGISGWVCQNNFFDQANTVHLYADHPFSSGGKHLYPNTVANIDKSSISSLCGGTTKHAFVFPASQLIHDGKEHSYYVYGIDLSGKNNNPLLYPSPVKVTCSTTPVPSITKSPVGIQGNVDASDCTSGIKGWACQNAYDSQHNTIDIYEDGPFSTGKLIGSATANNAGEDALKTYCGDTTDHRFVFSPDKLSHDDKAHNYYVYANDLSGKKQNSLLYKSPTSIICPARTYITIAVQLPGIGVGGNLSPKHTSRKIHISLYAADVDPTQPNIKPIFDTKSVTLTYNNNTGYFTNSSISIGNIPTGDYQLLLKIPGYLRKEVQNATSNAQTIHIIGNTSNLIPAITLITGDVAPLYNLMDVSDFYAIVGCYQEKANTSSCTAGDQITDLNDDGVINGIDLNIWLRGYQTLLSNNANGDGDGVTGD